MDDYTLLADQAGKLLAQESDFIANAANFASLLYHGLADVNWAGFYFARASGELVLGPFNGQPACTRLPAGRGVCGSAATTGTTVIVEDVDAFEDHIVCDTASRSEIAVPLRLNHKLLGVLDIDSPKKSRFSREDRAGIERLAEVFLESVRCAAAIEQSAKIVSDKGVAEFPAG
ncbi:MAG: GAF domain-containing protein [Candidatus Eremiobacteraeota bacterium]|nr:GAF domain-containing protein [Candidatus Eremiobacteraeota bacterium]